MTSQSETSPPDSVPTDASRRKILVVDDEPLIAKALGIQLKLRGYQPDVFTDSVEARDALRENPASYILVVADQKMPKLTGCELLAECRRIAPEIPFIFCSGHLSDHGDIATKADAFCSKPFSFQTLADVIERLIGQAGKVG